jgi:hypothetical protein
VYACFGIFFISCLSKVTLILRHLWKTKFQGMLTRGFIKASICAKTLLLTDLAFTYGLFDMFKSFCR